MLVFGLYMLPGILENDSGVSLAVGTFDNSMLLGDDGLPDPNDLLQHLCGWFCDSNISHAQSLLINNS